MNSSLLPHFFIYKTASTDFCLLAQWLIDGTRTFRFFVQSNQLCGGTKKVLWTFFARALKLKSEVEIETSSTDFCPAPYIAQSPLRKTGTRVPSSRMPSISIWLEPIMKSTWTSERLRPAASSSSSVNVAPPSTLVA